MPNYYDNWRTEIFNCPACEWRGAGGELSQGELTWDSFELLCPECGENVTWVMNPTVEEARANWDKLSDNERTQMEVVERLQANFARRKLREETPLPAINAPSFVLDWDFECEDGVRSETLIKHGGIVIFREPAIFEGYERFIEVARLLRARYGPALRDLIPTGRSELYLYGDRLTASTVIAQARSEIFPGS